MPAVNEECHNVTDVADLIGLSEYSSAYEGSSQNILEHGTSPQIHCRSMHCPASTKNLSDVHTDALIWCPTSHDFGLQK